MRWIVSVKIEKCSGQARHELTVQVAAHRPVVVHVWWRGPEHFHLTRINFAAFNQLIPHALVEGTSVDFARFHPFGGGVVGATKAHFTKILLWYQLLLLQEVARHEMTGRRPDTAKGKSLPFLILETGDL